MLMVVDKLLKSVRVLTLLLLARKYLSLKVLGVDTLLKMPILLFTIKMIRNSISEVLLVPM